MTVKGEEELERIGVEHFDRRIEQRHGEQLAIGRVLDREDIIRHLERLGVRHRQDAIDDPSLHLGRDFAHFELPKFHVLVRGTGDEPSSVGAHREGPQGTLVRGNCLEEGGGGEVVQPE